MSLIHMDGFDSYAVIADLSQEYSPTTLYNFSTTAGRFGGGALYLNSGNSSNGSSEWMGKTLPTATAEVWTGCAVNSISGATSNGVMMNFLSASGLEVQILYNQVSGTWSVYRGQYGNGGTQLGSSITATLSVGVYHWVEFHFVISGTVGVVEIWIDGVQVLNLTGVNTSYSGATTVTALYLGGGFYSYGVGAIKAYFDDWYILNTSGSHNNTRLGDSRIETLKPTSDAGPNNGTPSTAGSHYAMVNENQWASTNTITITNTSGQEELFGMSSLSGSPSTVNAVRVLAVAEKTDAGACSLEGVISSSSTVGVAAMNALATSYQHNYAIFETDPHTSAAFTASSINAMKVGVEVP